MTHRIALTVVVVLVVLADLAVAHAQTFDVARVDFRVLLPTGFSEPPSGSEDVELTTYSVDASVLVPIPLSEDFSLLAGASYRWLGPDLSGAPAVETRDFHEVGATLGATGRLNDQWTLTGIVAPSLASDFRELEADAINFRAYLAASVELDPRFTFQFGVLGSYQLGRFAPLPVAGFEWTPTDEDLIALQLPLSLRYAHTFGGRVQLALEARLAGNRHHATGAPSQSLRTTTVDVGVRAAVRLVGGLWLEAYGGAVLFRNFDVSDGNDPLFDGRIEPGGILQVSLAFRPPTQEETSAADDVHEKRKRASRAMNRLNPGTAQHPIRMPRRTCIEVSALFSALTPTTLPRAPWNHRTPIYPSPIPA